MSLEVIAVLAVLVCDIPKRYNVINGADGQHKGQCHKPLTSMYT